MAPLSAAFLILPHDKFGLHLDTSGNTMDAKLEMKNFQKAGELLCKLWNNTQIDNDIVKCTYHSPIDESMKIEPLTTEWVENHCSISQYCLQMAKCDDRSCCKEPRCDLKTIIQGKFLPGPLLIKRSEQPGMQLTKIGEEPLKGKRVYTSIMETMALCNLRLKGYEDIRLPYNLYCPSVQKKITVLGGDQYQRVFSGCTKLFTMLELAKNHLKVSGHRKLAQKESIDNCMDIDIIDEEIEIYSAAPLVAINDFMQKPFVEVAGLYDKDDVNE